MGLYISRTNIYSYTGRFFAFTYMTCLSILVDTGSTPVSICLIIGSSLIVATSLHLFLLNRSQYSRRILSSIARMLSLGAVIPDVSGDIALPYARTISRSTAAASFLLCMALGAPYVLASLVPEYRLTIANVGQILNSIAMIFILFYVDQNLYKSWDEKKLHVAVQSYNTGRIVGISLAGASLILVAIAILVIH